MPLSLFRNRTFSVTSAVGFIVGFALFGAVTYLPLYLQVTKGSSPTASGLQLTPLMGGRARHVDRERPADLAVRPLPPVPDRGHGAVAVAMFLLSRLDAGTSDLGRGARTRLVLGLGLGMVMQVLVLAVQNAVDRSGDGRRDERLDALPPDRRLDRRRALRAIFANRVHVELAHAAAERHEHPEDDQPGRDQAPAAAATLRSPMRSPRAASGVPHRRRISSSRSPHVAPARGAAPRRASRRGRRADRARRRGVAWRRVPASREGKGNGDDRGGQQCHRKATEAAATTKPAAKKPHAPHEEGGRADRAHLGARRDACVLHPSREGGDPSRTGCAPSTSSSRLAATSVPERGAARAAR